MDYEKFNEDTEDPVSFVGGYLAGKHSSLGWDGDDNLPFGLNPGRELQFRRMKTEFKKGMVMGQAVRLGSIPKPEWDDPENDEIVALLVEDKLDPQDLANRLLIGSCKANKMPKILSEEGHDPKEIIQKCEEIARERESQREMERASGLTKVFSKRLDIENPFKKFKVEGVEDALPYVVGYICGASSRDAMFVTGGEPRDEKGQKIFNWLKSGYELGVKVKKSEAPRPEWHTSGIDVAILLTNLNALSKATEIRDFLHPMAQDSEVHDCSIHQPENEKKEEEQQNGQNMPTNGGWRN